MKALRITGTVLLALLAMIALVVGGALTLAQTRFGGDLVARIARVDVAFNPLSLLRRRVEVSSVTIDRPELWLAQDAGGTNLGHALAPRQPWPVVAASDARGSGRGVTIDLRALSLQGGTVDYRAEIPDAPP